VDFSYYGRLLVPFCEDLFVTPPLHLIQRRRRRMMLLPGSRSNKHAKVEQRD
jgi:hypothetical protein